MNIPLVHVVHESRPVPDAQATTADTAQDAWGSMRARLRRITPRGLARLLFEGIVVLAIAGLLWTSRHLLLPFVVGAALAYVLAPLINLMERWVPRGVAILIIFGGFLALLVPLVLIAVPALVGQSANAAAALPGTLETLARHGRASMTSLPVGARTLITDWVAQATTGLKANLTTEVNHAVSLMGMVVFSVINTILFLLGFAIVPVWLFFLLQSGHAGRDALDRLLPGGMRADVWAGLRMVDRVFSSWIRGQVVLLLFFCTGVFLGMNVLTMFGVKGLHDILLLSVFAALMGLIPFVGSYLGALPAVVMALLTSWQGAVAVIALFVVVENIHDNVLSPKIMSKHLNIHPAILMPLMIVLGSFGLVWVILAGPLAAVCRDLIIYIDGRLGDPSRPAGQLPGDPSTPETQRSRASAAANGHGG
jgi:predicted PurR-regulated permease PerM